MSLTAEQLQTRLGGIGSSDSGAVIGVNPYRTPLGVYREKLGLSEPFEGNEFTHFGTILEEVIADEYTRRTGNKVRRDNRTLFHSEHTHMLAHLDRDVVGMRRLLECKTASFYVSHKWGENGTVITDASSDAAPPEYITQVHHQMIVRGYEEADMAVLIGGNDFRLYHLRLDVQFAEILIKLERAFWNDHVLAEVPPEPVTLDDVALLFPKDDGSTVTADAEMALAAKKLRATKALIKEFEVDQKALELAIKNGLGNASVLAGPDGKVLATWKAQTARRLDQGALKEQRPDVAAEFTKESEYRVLRLKKAA